MSHLDDQHKSAVADGCVVVKAFTSVVDTVPAIVAAAN